MVTSALTAVISYVIYGIAALLALIGLLMGLKRGTGKQSIRIVTIALSAFGSALLCKIFYSSVQTNLAGKTPAQIVESLQLNLSEDAMKVIESLDPDSAKFIAPLLVALILLPILFVLLFILISALMWIVSAIFSHIIFRERVQREGDEKATYVEKVPGGLSRLGGALIGLVQGVAVALILFFPIACLLGFSQSAINEMQKNDPDNNLTNDAVVFYEGNVKPINDNVVIRLTRLAGGNALMNYFSIIEIDGKETNMQDEGVAVFRVSARVSAMSRNTDWSNLSESDKATLNAIVEDVTGNPYLASLSASVLRAAVNYLDEQVANSSDMEEPMRTIVRGVLDSFSDITADSLAQDLGTVKDVYFLLSDAGVLVAMNEGGDITAALSATDENGNTVISGVIEKLNANERISSVTTALTDVSFAILLGNTGMDEELQRLIEEIKADVIEALNEILALDEGDFASHEEYVAEISSRVNTVLLAHDVELEDDVLDGIAEYIADPTHFTDKDGNRLRSITEAELAEFAVSYFSSVSSENS